VVEPGCWWKTSYVIGGDAPRGRSGGGENDPNDSAGHLDASFTPRQRESPL
jgi:hypothetical protein